MIRVRYSVLAATILTIHTVAAAPSEHEILAQHAKVIHGAKAGVDEEGHLWFWDDAGRTVIRISTDGARVRSARLPDAAGVDVDGRRGVAMLAADGQEVRVASWEGQILKTFRLPEPAGDIAWLTGSLVAVTPLFSDHRVAIWDTANGTLTRTVGKVLPITRGAGRHLARSTLVRYDRWRDALMALDATFGNVYVYGADGALLRSARLAASPTTVRDFLGGEPGAVILWRYSAASIARDGGLWLVDGRGENGVLTLLEFGTTGRVRRVGVTAPPCTGTRVVVWTETIVLFGPANPQEADCAAGVELASVRASATPVAGEIARAGMTGSYPPWKIMPNGSGCSTTRTEVEHCYWGDCSSAVCPVVAGWKNQHNETVCQNIRDGGYAITCVWVKD